MVGSKLRPYYEYLCIEAIRGYTEVAHYRLFFSYQGIIRVVVVTFFGHSHFLEDFKANEAQMLTFDFRNVSI